MATSAAFTLAEVSKHTTEEDCWLVIKTEDGKRKVYNPTKYLDDHPGGGQLLLDVAGTDCTEEFDDAGHSEDAIEELKRWEIGELEESEADIAARKNARKNNEGGGLSYFAYAVPIILGVLVFIGMRLSRK